MIMRPRITAIMACQTDKPVATMDDPIWKLAKAIIQTAHQPKNVQDVHCRRDGGRGRMSSFVHALTTEPGEPGWRRMRVQTLVSIFWATMRVRWI